MPLSVLVSPPDPDSEPERVTVMPPYGVDAAVPVRVMGTVGGKGAAGLERAAAEVEGGSPEPLLSEETMSRPPLRVKVPLVPESLARVRLPALLVPPCVKLPAA